MRLVIISDRCMICMVLLIIYGSFVMIFLIFIDIPYVSSSSVLFR